ncbi:hypothetical protein ACFLXE_04915 [Chloroflexota bacterium]
MEEKDLIKKLDNVDLHEIEVPSYRRRLRKTLLQSRYFMEQPKNGIVTSAKSRMKKSIGTLTRSLGSRQPVWKSAIVGMMSIVIVVLLFTQPWSSTTANKGDELVNLTDDPGRMSLWPSWSPDGSRIAYVSSGIGMSSGIYTMDADGANQTKIGLPYRVSARSLSWSPDGNRIVYAENYGGIQTVDSEGGDPLPVVVAAHVYQIYDWPSYSPDGSRIMFAATRGEGWDIFLVDIDGSNETCLTPPDVDDECPAWSPDGTRIAFDSNRDGPSGIYVMNADGSDPVHLTTGSEPTWSPDGSKIAFVSTRDGKKDIYIMDADGGNVARLTDNDLFEMDPEWSPDGRKMVFAGESGFGDPDIYTVDVPEELR